MTDKILEEESKTKKPREFVHLHVHTEYSLLDGMTRVAGLAKLCQKNNFPAIAITDHGGMYGAFTFQKALKKENIKPIIGCEIYTCHNMYDKSKREDYHLVLLAKNDAGYKNLAKINSVSFTEGFYYKPRIDLEFLRLHSEGLIALSGCIGGMIPQKLIEGDYSGAKEIALRLKEIFAEGDFYIEVQDHGIQEERMVNPLLSRLSKEIGCKLVATNDAHYGEKKDAVIHDILLCIQTKKDYDDPQRMRFHGDNFYLKDGDEMAELFSWCPEALDTPKEIADKCNAVIAKHDLYPAFVTPNGMPAKEYVRELTYIGLKERYGELTDEITIRAEHELAIIEQTGYNDYFLVVWDFIAFARQSGIPVGPGRGSGVGSIVAYAMRITDIDPLKFNLLFERFLNPERVSAPDFDIDFCTNNRGKVIEYVSDKYSKDKVCQILALGTLACKAVIRDVAKAYKLPIADSRRITKLIANGKVKLEKVLGLSKEKDEKTGVLNYAKEYSPELTEMYNTDENIRKILDVSMKLEGLPKNLSKHAAGVVICKEVISDFVPLSKSGEDVTTQFQKEEVEELGLLKMDFLGLNTLTDIDVACNYVAEDAGVNVEFDAECADPHIYEMISAGDTAAVFQIESPGMINFMKRLEPRNLEDIIAGVALFRPGPMDSIDMFVARKKDPSSIVYDHPLLEPILNMTYGCIVYQEQVMQIVQSLAGYTYGRADSLRRIMSKKKPELMRANKEIFINGCEGTESTVKDGVAVPGESAVAGCIKRGIPLETADKVFEDMASFAKYAFNKSHATAYSVLTYQTAYLKYYYPLQFFCSIINNRITNQDEVAKYVQYCRNRSYTILPPDINKSKAVFRVEGDSIRYGLTGIRGVGEQAISLIIADREEKGVFKGLNDFIERASRLSINKKLIESLIYAGAMDVWGHSRSTLIANYERIIQGVHDTNKKQAYGQMSMFDLFGDVSSEEPLYEMPEYELYRKLNLEKDVLGIYMSGHPLDDYRLKFDELSFDYRCIQSVIEANDEEDDENGEPGEQTGERDAVISKFDGKQIQMGGILSDVRTITTKDGKAFAAGTIEDLYGAIPIVLFPQMYERYKEMTVNDNIVLVQGKLDLSDRPQLRVNRMENWVINKAPTGNKAYNSNEKLCVKVKTLDEYEQVVRPILNSYSGETCVMVQLNGKLFEPKLRVSAGSMLLCELAAAIGKENVKKI